MTYNFYNKKKKKIKSIEVGITSQDNLRIVETEKNKYDILANEVGLLYKANSKIIANIITWDGVVTKYHSNILKYLNITATIEAYIQYRSNEENARNHFI
ncbi:hypothetical protein TCON_2799 [Astathelohania contejeani]|uniref:Uncharacterized protein n=1 Tax=Astathelohania contejeani TaxID=164912 RepID=A0ABQ7HUZ8_9MICR|nr:hypothetical protein TCON_2799 [Thelohania contejeani]